MHRVPRPAARKLTSRAPRLQDTSIVSTNAATFRAPHRRRSPPIAARRAMRRVRRVTAPSVSREVVHVFRDLILELDANVRDDARSTTWTSVRTFFSSTVALIEPATSAKRVSDVLRDLESGFLVSGQRAEWLEAARARWVARVREIGRTEDAFGDENMTGFLTLLGQLAASLKTESFRVEFMSPVPLVAVSSERSTSTRTMLSRRGISMYGAWRLKLLALLGFDAASEMDPSFEDRFGEDITVQAYGTETDALGFEYPRSRSRRFQLGLYSTGSGDDDDEEEEEDEEDEDDDEYASTIDIEQSTMNELSEEVKRLRCRVENAERALNCGICLTSKRDAIIFPCMHAMYCHDCLSKHYAMRNSQNAKKCPCCRAVMTGIMRTFP